MPVGRFLLAIVSTIVPFRTCRSLYVARQLSEIQTQSQTDVSQGVLEGHRLVLICTPVFASGHLTNMDRGRFDSTRNDHGQPGCVRASIRIRSEYVWPSRYVFGHSA